VSVQPGAVQTAPWRGRVRVRAWVGVTARVRVRARARAGVRVRVRVGSGLGLGPGLGFVSVFGFRLGFLPPVAPGVNHGQVAHTAIGGMRGAVWRAWLGLELELGLGLATPKP